MNVRLLRLLRLPPQPEPPPGSGPTLSVFRASRRLFYLKATGWALRQTATLVGIALSLAFLAAVEGAAATSSDNQALIAVAERVFEEDWERVRAGVEQLWGVIWVLEVLAVLFFLIGAAISWALLRLDWEARWYMVSEESLRIREGLLRTHERTMTVANIQQLTIRRGPLQRLLGIADLEVRTAGGGTSAARSSESVGSSHDLHVGRFRGIDDAEGLRDRIQASLLRHRDSGLGDPDEESEDEREGPAIDPGLERAAGELLAEARGLRLAAERWARAGL